MGYDPSSPECLLTPNLDELADGGTFFSHAYAECPSCVPARRSLFSGLALADGAEERIAPWRQRLIEVLNGRPEGFTDGERLIPGRPYTTMIPGYENGTVLPFV